MLANSYALTYNAENLTLVRTNQNNYGSSYFGKLGTDRDVSLEIKHTFPPNRLVKGPESHLIKFSINYYNTTDGTLLRTNRVWLVMECRSGIQDNSALKSTNELLTEIMAVAGFQDALLNRES